MRCKELVHLWFGGPANKKDQATMATFTPERQQRASKTAELLWNNPYTDYTVARAWAIAIAQSTEEQPCES